MASSMSSRVRPARESTHESSDVTLPGTCPKVEGNDAYDRGRGRRRGRYRGCRGRRGTIRRYIDREIQHGHGWPGTPSAQSQIAPATPLDHVRKAAAAAMVAANTTDPPVITADLSVVIVPSSSLGRILLWWSSDSADPKPAAPGWRSGACPRRPLLPLCLQFCDRIRRRLSWSSSAMVTADFGWPPSDCPRGGARRRERINGRGIRSRRSPSPSSPESHVCFGPALSDCVSMRVEVARGR